MGVSLFETLAESAAFNPNNAVENVELASTVE